MNDNRSNNSRQPYKEDEEEMKYREAVEYARSQIERDRRVE
jgi:hypothetical protein